MAEVIHDLIGDDFLAAGKRSRFFHVVRLEVAHAVIADLPRAFEGLEGFERFCKRLGFAPVEEIEVEIIGL